MRKNNHEPVFSGNRSPVKTGHLQIKISGSWLYLVLTGDLLPREHRFVVVFPHCFPRNPPNTATLCPSLLYYSILPHLFKVLFVWWCSCCFLLFGGVFYVEGCAGWVLLWVGWCLNACLLFCCVLLIGCGEHTLWCVFCGCDLP